MSQQAQPLILASGSPRRRAILKQLGLHFEVSPAQVSEKRLQSETPTATVLRLARLKAEQVAACHARSKPAPFVLGADTLVVLGRTVLTKPQDDGDANRMLELLSGSTHEVVTGLALSRAGSGSIEQRALVSRVRFRELSPDCLRSYVASGEGRDKAGAYGIQGLGAGFVLELHGSYTNVVGLPAAQTLEMLERHGVVAAWP
ncbi:MAG: Maf family protein [Proteobacteria bacterium]|nr:Maf family protein [Pseudomonadota bacterium]